MRDFYDTNEVRIAKFDPVALGITEYVTPTSGNKERVDRDYVIQVKNGSSTNIIFNLCAKTCEFVKDMYGDTVSVGINEKGQIFIWAGGKTKIASNAHSRGRGRISINGMRYRLTQCYGRYKRIYFKMKPYANGDALVFTHTGEVDKDA